MLIHLVANGKGFSGGGAVGSMASPSRIRFPRLLVHRVGGGFADGVEEGGAWCDRRPAGAMDLVVPDAGVKSGMALVQWSFVPSLLPRCTGARRCCRAARGVVQVVV